MFLDWRNDLVFPWKRSLLTISPLQLFSGILLLHVNYLLGYCYLITIIFSDTVTASQFFPDILLSYYDYIQGYCNPVTIISR